MKVCLGGGLRSVYHADIRGIPVIETRGVMCRAGEVDAIVVTTGDRLLRSPYGQAVFVDVPSRRALWIRSRRQCTSAAGKFTPGPFALPGGPPAPAV